MIRFQTIYFSLKATQKQNLKMVGPLVTVLVYDMGHTFPKFAIMKVIFITKFPKHALSVDLVRNSQIIL